MKIALCLSGQPRSLEAGAEYIKRNIIEGNDVSIFAHVWGTEKDRSAIYRAYTTRGKYLFVNNDVVFPPSNDLMNQKYSKIGNEKHPPCNTLSMFHSIFAADYFRGNVERMGNDNFDFVVRCRYDYAVNVKIPFDQLKKGTLYTPFEPHLHQRGMVTDQFAIASPEIMTRYASTWLFVDEVVNSDYFPQGGSGEDLLTQTLIHMHGISPQNAYHHRYIEMNHPFPPGKYNGTPHSLIRDDFSEWNKLRE